MSHGSCDRNTYGNECVTKVNYGTEVRTTESFVADADQQNILESPIDDVLRYYFYLLYFHSSLLGTCYNIDETIEKRLDELREIGPMVL